jgi:hypothetical protein
VAGFADEQAVFLVFVYKLHEPLDSVFLALLTLSVWVSITFIFFILSRYRPAFGTLV